MRILYIDVNYKYSSTGKIVKDLCSQCNNNGHFAAVCYGRGPKVNEPGVYKFSRPAEVFLHLAMTRLTGLTGYYSPFATRNLLKLISDFKPDVVHIHEAHAYFMNPLPLINYLKKNNIRTIWTFHCEFMYTGKCGIAFKCNKWQTGCGHCPNVKNYPRSLWFDFTRKMYDDKKKAFEGFNNLVVVAPSKWLADRIRKSFLRTKCIKVIHNGIDNTDVFFPRPHNHLKTLHNITTEKVVLSVASNLMTKEKGGGYILSLAKDLEKENVKFILIGAKQLNEMPSNVITLKGIADQKILAEYYSLADVYVTCSRSETFGLTNIESVSCGTPVCGFEAGGNVGLIREEYGRFVKYGDMHSLKKVLLDLLDEHNSANKCAQYGQKYFSKEKMFSEYMRFYKSNKTDLL